MSTEGYQSGERQYYPHGHFLYVSKGIKYKSISCVCEAASKHSVEEEYKIDRALVVDIGSNDLAEGSDVIAVLGTCRIYPRFPNRTHCGSLHFAKPSQDQRTDGHGQYAFSYQPLIYYWKDQFWTDAVNNLNCPATHRMNVHGSISHKLRLKQYSIIYPLTNEKNDG